MCKRWRALCSRGLAGALDKTFRGEISGNLDNVRKSNLREPLIFLGNHISKFLDFTTKNEPVKTCVSLINILLYKQNTSLHKLILWAKKKAR
ncbi:MAG: hypothetical protein ACO2PO_12870 [Candidatus Calescibacterium sp.]